MSNRISSGSVKKSPLRGMSTGHENADKIDNEAKMIPKLLLRRTSHIRSILCTECIQKREVPAEIKKVNEIEESGEIKRFIDPDGHDHIHDMSMITIEYSCSNNHRWSVKESKNKCWCLHYQSSPLSSGSYSPRSSNNESLVYVSPRRTVYPKGGSFISFPNGDKSESSESEETSPIMLETLESELKSKTMRQSPNRTRSSHN